MDDARRADRVAAEDTRPFLESEGHCPTCDRDVTFVARDPWLRDHFLCSGCGSLPRERALMVVIDRFFPQWRELVIHESSPEPRGASERLRRECRGYVPSQYFPDQRPGQMVGSVRCENLEALTFEPESVGLHVTQDVMEHIFHPDRAFREVARTLRPGGAHVFTVPLVNAFKPSAVRATIGDDGKVRHLADPVFHGNPISAQGALVTVDWGYDICREIFEASGLFTHVIHIEDLGRGIKAEYTEVLVTVKPDLR